MATQKKDPRAATCRNAGAVGKNPLVYQAFRNEFTPQDINSGHAVLDFGAGKDCVHTQKLRLEGYADVWAHDLPENQPELPSLCRGWARIDYFKWKVVLLSNVLNVQTSKREVARILHLVKNTMTANGSVILNYPSSPRKSKVTVTELYKMMEKTFNPWNIMLVGGTKSAPCWMVEF